MSEFHSNITFGRAPTEPSCNGLCRFRDDCSACKAAWRRTTERMLAKVEAFRLDRD